MFKYSSTLIFQEKKSMGSEFLKFNLKSYALELVPLLDLKFSISTKGRLAIWFPSTFPYLIFSERKQFLFFLEGVFII